MHQDIKKIIVRGLLFLLPLIVLLVSLEVYLRQIPTSYSVKRVYLEQQENNVQVLALGSSHAYFGINPSYFGLVGFNLADVGQTLFYDKELALKYIDAMPKLKCVLIESSYFSFGYDLNGKTPEGWRDYFYYHYWGIKQPNLTMDSRAWSYTMLYTPRAVLGYLFRGAPTVSMERTGWSPFEHGDAISDEAGRIRVANHDASIRPENYERNISYLKTILSALKERGIGSVIVSEPTYKTYYQFLNTQTEKRDDEILSNLCKDYGCGRYNFTRDQRFTIRDFADNDHLNPDGAKKFSAILGAEVLPRACKAD